MAALYSRLQVDSEDLPKQRNRRCQEEREGSNCQRSDTVGIYTKTADWQFITMVTTRSWVVVLLLVMHLLVGLTSGLLSQAGRESLLSKAAEFTGGSRAKEEALVSEYESRLLNMFGLSRRPNPAPGSQVPRIMQHFYKAHMGNTYKPQKGITTSWETGFDLPSDELLSRVNTARSFLHIGKDCKDIVEVVVFTSCYKCLNQT